ncbi:hypothetical protein A2W70_00735 [Candidatus Curtissbacteria bacterium RIFCSPLOWO2_02_41_11]|uniref:Uncharacterized protein n=2 Tax=Candidatus Curtissiibacteriota TaxID=1752717 RepID=A0A1F5HU95_9BACT|nr:MAG: hypothetical protein UU56_C0025G0011 [Candidatus Curtissbacteria bacterium GW2011_GWA2_41_24]OGE07748.1 MAG: hypothetical protein A2W70_00735 [Candidatus Curtissbacteria bacterium RIFCSPLOWO2_02_41_11]
MGKETEKPDFLQALQLGFEKNIANIVGIGASLNLLGNSLIETPRHGVDGLVILQVVTGVILGIAVFANSAIEGKQRLNNPKNELPTSNRS